MQAWLAGEDVNLQDETFSATLLQLSLDGLPYFQVFTGIFGGRQAITHTGLGDHSID